MKTIIVYATKTGATEECANKLKNMLPDTEIVNIENINNFNLDNYEQIIIGTPIRIGQINKKIKDFVSKNLDKLKLKKVSIFICCGFIEGIDKYFTDNFPNDLLEQAITYDTFGGKLDLDKQKGLDKFVVKMISKSNADMNIKILDNKIEEFVNKLN